VAALEARMLTALTDRQARDLRRYLVACRAALAEQPAH